MVTNKRLTSIGASDAAAALGVCPWKSKFQLWAEKTGVAEPPDLDAVEAVFWGNDLEPNIVRRFGAVTGRHIEHNEATDVTRHPEFPFLTATLDAIQADDEKGIGALEAKNVGHYMMEKWATEAPLWVQVQLQHQLACTGMTWGSMVALCGGNKMIWYDQDRNDKFIEAMIDKESFFWTQVLNKTPPDPDGSIATTECLRRLYPKDDGEIIALPEEACEWDVGLLIAKAHEKEAEENRRRYENHIKAALGTATTGVLPDGARYTFKQQVRNNKATEASVSRFRVLRRQSQ